MGLDTRKPVNIKGTDQHEHPRSLISTFIILLWKVSYLDIQFEKYNKIEFKDAKRVVFSYADVSVKS